MRSRNRGQAGFSFVAVMFMMLLVLSISVCLCVLIANESNLTSSLDSQLYSLILAENGVEYARSLLPQLDLNLTLTGRDGGHAGTAAPEWRNPLSFDTARVTDLDSWQIDCDDGWPAYQGTLLLEKGYRAFGDGRFFIRFSNNPLEPANEDKDGVVLVRSMGITPANRTGLFHSARNNVSLVEAVLRQERVFDLQAALVLFGREGHFEWPSEGFAFNGGANPAVAVIGESQLIESLITSLTPDQRLRFQGAGGAPSLRDTTAVYMASPIYGRVFDARFWSHFQDHLPEFVDTRLPGIRFYPEGGGITGSFEGILVARGDFSVAGASIEGLLLHLGDGRLTLGADATVRGAVWMSNNRSDTEGKLVHQQLELKLLDSVSVVYDADAVRHSLTLLPPTQLGWRILFPEMKL